MKNYIPTLEKIVQNKLSVHKGNISALQRDLNIGRKLIQKIITKKTKQKSQVIPKISASVERILIQEVDAQCDLYLRELQELVWEKTTEWRSKSTISTILKRVGFERKTVEVTA
jgi:hypothetical protein